MELLKRGGKLGERSHSPWSAMAADDLGSEGRERRNNNGTKERMDMVENGEEPICRTLFEVLRRKTIKKEKSGLREFNGRNGGRLTDSTV